MSLPTQQLNADVSPLPEQMQMERAASQIPQGSPCLQRKKVLETELARYLDILEQQEGIEQVILFGSMVTQQIHEYSDIDLIVIQRSDLTFLKRLNSLRRLLSPQVGTDLLVYTPEEFQQISEGLFFQVEIISKGVVVSTSGQWLKFATEDLQVAELALPQGLYNPACFHAQQCVEKSIKAALIHRGTVPPRTHASADLLRLMPTEFLYELRDQLDELDSFYMLTRYPDTMTQVGRSQITEADAADAIALARSVLEQVEQRCSVQ